jgi:hypothetical protein
MRTYEGRLVELQQISPQETGAWFACPPEGLPDPGRYVLAVACDPEAPLAVPLFPSEISSRSFLAAPPFPADWQPGQVLRLRGPLGRGFRLPTSSRRAVLAALGDTFSRLLPLAHAALRQNAAVALYTNSSLPGLPAAIEAHPLSSLPDGLGWADFLALDVPREDISSLEASLGQTADRLPPIPAQVLVTSAFPCAGMGSCGVCAVQVGRTWKLACIDGPVFDLNEILGSI